MSPLYRNSSTITGTLKNGNEIQYQEIMTRKQRFVLNIFGVMLVLTSLVLISWIVIPTGQSLTPMYIVTLGLMFVIEVIRVVQTATLWIFAKKSVDPVPLIAPKGLRVAILTTIVPGKEPFDLVLNTLKAMKKITYEGIVDVWLLDEGNDPAIKLACTENGVHHFSRKGCMEWNTESGPFKAKTKHGNHNAWRAKNELDYDIVAQMDPDHVPVSDFLERTLGYFLDPDIAFVVAPQVYGNQENFIARAAAFQSYVFHGVIQRGGNGMRAPLLIGTNHLYRVVAFSEIGGYQDSIIEDHLTSMAMYCSRNASGNYWKGVYTPDILAVGEGPTSFTDYFNQQKRWAYGIMEIVTKHSPRMFGGMKKTQKLSFAMLQFFYPSVAASWLTSIMLTGLYLTGNVEGKPVLPMLVIWGFSLTTSLGFFMWLRRFNLIKHERKTLGLGGMALLLMCIPIYVAAAMQALCRRKLTYAVTAKGNLATPDRIRTFTQHIMWALLLVAMLIGSFFGLGSAYFATKFWLSALLVICLSPVSIHLIGKVKSGRKLDASEFEYATNLLPSKGRLQKIKSNA